MANRKFEFTGETKVQFGITFRRIRALISFGSVVAGEVGGLVEKESAISTEGDAWVSGDARVSGNAQVYGDARVSGDAQVSGDAWVSGNADFFLLGPIGSRKAFLTIHSDTKIGVRFSTGCFSGSENEFKASISATHGGNEYAKQYHAAIDMAQMMVKQKK